MIRRTIEFATPGTVLSVSNRQLVVKRPSEDEATLPIEDLGVVVVDDVRATYTQSVFLELTRAGACVLICGRDHLPAAMLLPIVGHHAQTERHLVQVGASTPTKKRIWQALVKRKILQQAAVLSHFSGGSSGLVHLASRVRSGDPRNIEAQAAQRYWPTLFGASFRRDRAPSGINALLNYGYAVVRASVARALVAAGLIPSLGVHHKNRRNPFCLADDLLEPYRPLVDWCVKGIDDDRNKAHATLEDREVRARILSLLNETVRIRGKNEPLLFAVQSSADSLRRALTGDELVLHLPEGLPRAAPIKRD